MVSQIKRKPSHIAIPVGKTTRIYNKLFQCDKLVSQQKLIYITFSNE